MKFSENWLREFVNPDIDSETLMHQLTMAGLEVDGNEPACSSFDELVVAEVKSVSKHPDADKLHICEVDCGEKELLTIEEAYVNGSAKHRLPHVSNISFKFVEGEGLMMTFNQNIGVSSGSACTSASLEPSYVLKSMGLDDELAHSSMRFSLGRFSTEEEVDFAVEKVCTEVERLREMSPLWEMVQEGIDISKVKWTVH